MHRQRRDRGATLLGLKDGACVARSDRHFLAETGMLAIWVQQLLLGRSAAWEASPLFLAALLFVLLFKAANSAKIAEVVLPSLGVIRA